MQKIRRILVLLTVSIGVAAITLVLTSAIMTRMNPLGFRTALSLFRYGVYAAVGAGTLSLAAVFLSFSAGRKKSLGASLFVSVASFIIVIQASQFKRRAIALPLIHDITTDTEHPPEFKAIVPLREGTASNSLDYEGPRVADQQRQAYPEVQPLTLRIPASQVFELALKVARDMGWEIVHSSEAEGHIEATATTAFFGFKDDLVIRVTDLNDKTRLDVRSVSRVGLSDVGANAERIKAFLEKVNQG